MKIERTIGITKDLKNRFTWEVILFEPKTNFSFSVIKPGSFDKFSSKEECIKNIKETFKKLGMKIDMKKKEVTRI